MAGVDAATGAFTRFDDANPFSRARQFTCSGEPGCTGTDDDDVELHGCSGGVDPAGGRKPAAPLLSDDFAPGKLADREDFFVDLGLACLVAEDAAEVFDFRRDEL